MSKGRHLPFTKGRKSNPNHKDGVIPHSHLVYAKANILLRKMDRERAMEMACSADTVPSVRAKEAS
jgi:hypothetical protein